MAREFTWMRRESRLPVALPMAEGAPPSLAPTGVECHTGPALYDDGGPCVVIDTVKDLEFAVLDVDLWRVVRRFPLDLDAAVAWARDLNDLLR